MTTFLAVLGALLARDALRYAWTLYAIRRDAARWKERYEQAARLREKGKKAGSDGPG